MKREDQRVIFRELYPRGWTAVDDIDEITLGHAPNPVACHRSPGDQVQL